VDWVPSRLPFFDAPPPGAIGPVHAKQLREWPLVLSSMEIPCETRRYGRDWYILVDDGNVGRAVEAIRLYQAENRDWPPRVAKERLAYPLSPVAPVLLGALIAFHAITGPSAGGSHWFADGAASSARIFHGAVWQTVTALTLHADWVHVTGNALSGTIFLSAVNRRLGDGRGSFLFLMTGAIGNLFNALWYRTNHVSIGASTAVFAAVGILAATQLVSDRRARQRPRGAWAKPIAAGLALLGMLGASPQSDLLAHLFGFIAGLLGGLVAAFWVRSARPSKAWVQILFGLATLGMVAGAWGLALGGPWRL
jgi:membrane associated rhomboid family serine protease